MWTWILIGLHIITKVHGFANGNFPESCNSLSPQHLSFVAQTSAPPFKVDLEGSDSGVPFTVVLSSTGSTRFRGFMMEAREADSGTQVGTFISLDDSTTRLLTCDGAAGSAVSQRNNQQKSVFRVNWTAPEINQHIVFRATFVQDFVTFWENVTSTFRLSTNTPVPSTTTNTPATSTTTNTPAPSTTTNTPVPSTTTNTPASSTTTNTPAPSTTTNTPTPSTTTNTPEESTTTNTPAPSTTTITPKQSTTTTITPAPTKTTTKTTVVCLGACRPTDNSTHPPPPPPPPPPSCPPPRFTKIGTALMCVGLILEEVKMDMSNIFAVLISKGTHRCCSEVTKIALSILCAGFEIASLILFAIDYCPDDILIGLVCAVIVINVTEQAIWSLTVRCKLEQRGIIAGKVCFVVHQSFTIAVLYVGISIICEKDWRDSWPLKVLTALTVWTFLNAVWILGFSTTEIQEANENGPVTLMLNGRENLRQKERGSPELQWRRATFHPEDNRSANDLRTTQGFNSFQQNRSQQSDSQQKQKKNHAAVQVSVSLLFIILTTALAVIVLVGICLECQKN